MFDSLRQNQYFKEVVNFLKKKNLYEVSYLVGGTVRDLLSGRQLKDFDFAIKADTIELARDFAKETGRSFVLLDETFSIGRTVKEDVTIDFAELRGGSIEADLAERDFTINAIAIPLSLDRIIDPFEGKRHIEHKLIKMINEENLRADPLRILRAYRFHATLNFEIDDETRHALKANASLLKITARERIKDELWKTLSVDSSLKTVKLMVDDGIFNALFKTDKLMPLKTDLRALEIVEKILKEPDVLFSSSIDRIIYRDYVKVCLKFASLFNFQASGLIKQIKPSKKEERIVEDLIRASAELRKIETLLDKVRFIRNYESIIYLALIYGLSQDPLGFARLWFYRNIEEFYRKNYLRNKKKLPLLKGEDIISLGFEPSPLVGEILERIETLVLAGKISKKEEAVEEIKNRYLSKISPP